MGNRSSVPITDVAVIGAGVVGCAVIRKLAMLGASSVLLEASTDILAGASKANSALLHTGFDAPPGSVELQLMQQGYREYLAIHADLNLPLLECGALVVAWSEAELARLSTLGLQAIANGVDDVQMISAADVLRREPCLSRDLRGALWVPGEHVIDSWSAPLAYLTQALANGAEVWFQAEVLGGDFDGHAWMLQTARGPMRAKYVVNCAGLYGDVVEERCLGERSFTIRPRKGQFVVFDKPAAKCLSSIILPVPTELTKGVILTRTIYGNVLVGPTAEEQEDRTRATVDQHSMQTLVAQAHRMIPALRDVPVTACYAGLRPATEEKHYRVQADQRRHWVTLGGIRSTGLTASLGLASHAADLLDVGRWSVPPAAALWTPVPNLADHLERDWERPGFGEIVCHCEMVTRREIENAFASPVPPGNFGGLRRRTRAAMGRCQGFYCGAQLAALTQARFSTPLATPMINE